MTGTLFKQTHFNLAGLIEAIGLGQIGLPDLQRPFVWPNTKVRDLFDSMYRGYPVGYLLFWENGAVEGPRAIGAETKQIAPQLLVIDGQQRLTSLYAVMRAVPVLRQNFESERIQIAFRPLDGSFEVADAAIRNDPRWIPDISTLWSPQSGLLDIVRSYLEGLNGAGAPTPAERQEIERTIQRLAGLVHFPFTALQLSASLDEEQVAEVFVRINSKGTPLNQADFILTLMSVFRDGKRAEVEDFCRRARVPTGGASPFNHFLDPEPDQLLRVSVGLGFRRAQLQHVYSILRGKDLETGEFSAERRERQFAILDLAQDYALDLTNWKEYLKCLLLAGYRSGRMVSSRNALLYSYVFYLLGKRDYGVDRHRLHRAIARWFFFVSLTGRYTTSPKSRMEQDLADLRGVQTADGFLDHLERTIASAFTSDYWQITLPAELATSAARSPGLFAYYAALNLLDARVLFSQLRVSELLDPAAQSKKRALERHHLFPKAHLQRQGVASRRDVNQIANFALVEWPDNIAISDRAPEDYFPELVRCRGLAAESSFWHALPDGWERMDYPRFLEERRRLIAAVVKAGFGALAAPREIPSLVEPEAGVTERALVQLDGETRRLVEDLLAEPPQPVTRLRAELAGYLARLEVLGGEERTLDLDAAQRIAERCFALLDRAARGGDQEAHRLIQAACLYFVLAEDADSDLGESGFADDLAVVSAVERALASAAMSA